MSAGLLQRSSGQISVGRSRLRLCECKRLRIKRGLLGRTFSPSQLLDDNLRLELSNLSIFRRTQKFEAAVEGVEVSGKCGHGGEVGEDQKAG